MPSIKREIRHLHVAVVHSRQRNVKKNKRDTCRVVVLSIQPIPFLTFSLPSPSWHLKVPNRDLIM